MAKKDRAAFGGMEGIKLYNTNAATNGTNAANGEYQYIPADKLKASPFNDGMPMDESTIQSYVASMSDNGLIQPISVYDLGDGTYEIISGHQRYEAWCKRLHHDTIPAVINKYEPDIKKRFSAHTEANTRSRNLDGRFWFSRIQAAEKIIADTEGDLPKADVVKLVCEMLGLRSAPQYYRYTQFGALIPAIQDLEADGTITVKKAVLVNKLDEKQQEAVAELARKTIAEREALHPGEENPELTTDEFKKIINTVVGSNEKRPPTRLMHETRINQAGIAFISMLNKSKTTQEAVAALVAIKEMRKKLDESEKMLKERIDSNK